MLYVLIQKLSTSIMLLNAYMLKDDLWEQYLGQKDKLCQAYTLMSSFWL